MRLLFWNTYNNKNINSYVMSLVEENEIDILVLAEYTGNENELSEYLQQCKKRLFKWNTLGCDRIKIWGNYVNVEPVSQNKYYSIQVVDRQYIVCGVHMYSNLNGECYDERTHLAGEIMYDIKSIKDKIYSDKVIILGDMNESPYEKTCLSANGFHALPALKVSDKKTRIIYQKEYEKMYNPMWNLFGDFEYPPGTYYRTESRFCNPGWYMLDQVIISQAMISSFVRKGLRIITVCGEGKLYTDKKYPNRNISDHCPIMCEFNI